MTRRRRWVLAAILLAIIALPFMLLTSETALRIGVGIAADRIAALEVDDVRGRLLTGVSARRVAWRDDTRPTVTITGFASDWRFLPALTGRLHLGAVSAETVVVSLPPPDDEPDADHEPFQLPSRIEIPLVIRIGELHVGIVSIERGGAQVFGVEAVDAAGLYADPRTFSVERFAAVGDPVSFEFEGTLQPAGAWALQLDGRWRALLPGHPRLDGTLTVDGALDRSLSVAAAARSDDAGSARFDGVMRSLIQDPRIEGRLAVDGGRLEQWVDDAPVMQLSAELDLDGWLEDLGVAGTAAVGTPDWPRADLEVDVHWGTRLLAVRRVSVRADGLPTEVAASGHYDWSEAAPSGNVRARWVDLQWPLDGPRLLASTDGRVGVDFGGGTGRADVNGQFGDDPAGRVRAVADLQWLDDEPVPRADLSADWDYLQLFGVESARGRVNAQGSLADWTGEFNAVLSPPGVPPVTLAADVAGDDRTLQATELHAEWLGGTAHGGLELAWADGLRGSIGLTLADVDPSHFVPAWDGRVGGRVDATLAADEHGLVWRGRLRDGSGTVDGRPFTGRADAQGVDASLERVDAAVAIGDAEATVRGAWAPDIDLTWSVRAPQLGVLFADASGSLRGEGFVRGALDAPAFGFDVDGSELAYRDVAIERLSGSGTVDLADAGQARATLRADTLATEEQEVDSVELSVAGTRDALTLSLAAAADVSRIALEARGAWADDRFAGELASASAVYDDEPPWRLRNAAALEFGPAAASLDDACWAQAGTPNELCVAGEWRAGVELNARVGLTGLPLEELSAWLPLGFQYSGRIGGDATLAWRADGEPEIDGRLSIIDGSWRHQVGAESVALLQWNDASIEGRLRDGTVHATTGFELVDGGNLRAVLELPVTDTDAGPADQRPLRARLTGEFSDFDLLPALVPDIGSVTGRVHADLTVSGTPDAPLFAGDLRLDDGTATIPRLGIRLTDLGLGIDGNRDELALRASTRSGPGTLELDGRFGLRDGRLAGEIDIRGDDFEAADIPEARVRISPRLTVGLVGHAVNLEGEVRVPFARIAPRDLGGTVNVSDDEILIDEEEVLDEVDRWRITSRVRVVLGDVRFDGFGLTARVTGGLTAIDAPGQPTIATGELQVQEGRYQAWGQQLEIEHGRLVFTGGPITEPGVDVLAVRRPQDVTVGVNVRGTLRDPELRLYSEPGMQQAEQLSWLMLGMPLNRATGSEQALLDRTRDTAGLAGGDLALRELGRRLGIGEVGIDRGDTPEEAAVVIGHYLSPRVYIGYGIGIFEPSNSIRFRYHIDRNWSIEAETGERSTSTDLRFTIER